MKKVSLMAAMALATLFALTGCKEAGDDFIGQWDRVQKKIPDKEDMIEISREDGVFHISNKRWSMFKGPHGDYVTDRVQARAESEKVLSVIGGVIQVNATYVIENGNLFTSQGEEYTRVK
ncbi:hypothetical protein D9M69_120570 [compost metagenome]